MPTWSPELLARVTVSAGAFALHGAEQLFSHIQGPPPFTFMSFLIGAPLNSKTLHILPDFPRTYHCYGTNDFTQCCIMNLLSNTAVTVWMWSSPIGSCIWAICLYLETDLEVQPCWLKCVPESGPWVFLVFLPVLSILHFLIMVAMWLAASISCHGVPFQPWWAFITSNCRLKRTSSCINGPWRIMHAIFLTTETSYPINRHLENSMNAGIFI